MPDAFKITCSWSKPERRADGFYVEEKPERGPVSVWGPIADLATAQAFIAARKRIWSEQAQAVFARLRNVSDDGAFKPGFDRSSDA